MWILSRLALALSTLLTAALAGGCSRTPDGTVVIPKQMDSRRFWQDDDARRAASQQAQASSFPSEPEIRFVTQEPRPRPATRSASISAPQGAGNAKPLGCHGIPGDGGRIKYVCD